MCTMLSAQMNPVQCKCRRHSTVVYSYIMLMRWHGLCRHIKGLMRRAGLAVREDAMGNIFGRWQGSQPGAGAVHMVSQSLVAQQHSKERAPCTRHCSQFLPRHKYQAN
jgi:hypothetical protein